MIFTMTVANYMQTTTILTINTHILYGRVTKIEQSYHATTDTLADACLYCPLKRLYQDIWMIWNIQILQMVKLDIWKYKTNTNQLR